MCAEIKTINKIRAWSWNIISSGLPAEHDLEALRKIFLLNLIILVGGLFLAFLGATALIQQDNLLGAVDMTLLLFLICLSLYLRRSKDHHSVEE